MKQLELFGVQSVRDFKFDIEIANRFDWNLIYHMLKGYRSLYAKRSDGMPQEFIQHVIETDIDPLIKQAEYYEAVFMNTIY